MLDPSRYLSSSAMESSRVSRSAFQVLLDLVSFNACFSSSVFAKSRSKSAASMPSERDWSVGRVKLCATGQLNGFCTKVRPSGAYLLSTFNTSRPLEPSLSVRKPRSSDDMGAARRRLVILSFSTPDSAS
jgi:hypothetical protein